MNLDKLLYRLPLVGWVVRRLYNYFKVQTALTDFFHVLIGFGLGLIIVGEGFFFLGLTVLMLGTLFHLYAFIKGGGMQ